MGTDAFFRMGSSHLVCQDYAVAGTQGLDAEAIEYAIVSDGCSGFDRASDTGFPHTDIGARLITRRALSLLRGTAQGTLDVRWLRLGLQSSRTYLDLNESALDATLLVLARCGNYAHAYVMGDGVIATKWRSGRVSFASVSFSENAPFYPGYEPGTERHRTFMALEQTKSWRCDTGEESVKPVTDKELVDHYVCNAWDHETVLVMSDGAESFIDSTGSAVPLERVLEQMFDFKGYAGRFAARRSIKFLDKFCAETGWRHTDDFSVGALHFA